MAIKLEILGDIKLIHCWRCERNLPADMFIVEQCIECTKELEANK